jgi:hypothetical protein
MNSERRWPCKSQKEIIGEVAIRMRAGFAKTRSETGSEECVIRSRIGGGDDVRTD